jgi:hypothetical protein
MYSYQALSAIDGEVSPGGVGAGSGWSATSASGSEVSAVGADSDMVRSGEVRA